MSSVFNIQISNTKIGSFAVGSNVVAEGNISFSDEAENIISQEKECRHCLAPKNSQEKRCKFCDTEYLEI